MKKLNLNENFISKIWENPSFYSNLFTIQGERAEIIEYGSRNHDAGPDYYGAIVKIGGTFYTGDIEIHRTEKNWEQHKHKKDGKYDKVVLNVVMWETDTGEKPAVSKKAREIPTLVLSKFLTKSIHEIWKDIINNPSESFRLPCYRKNKSVPEIQKTDFINKTGIKRLKYRALRIRRMQTEPEKSFRSAPYWNKILFTFIAEALGFSKNKIQFLKFTERIDLQFIKSAGLDLIQVDSLFFGISGFLSEQGNDDKYIKALNDEWKKFKPGIRKEFIDKSIWNFFRLRPQNFPTLRLAYLSGICLEILHNDLMKKIIFCFENSKNPAGNIRTIFQNVKFSDYWKNHYHFGKTKNHSENIIGNSRINDIIVNVLLPVLYLYAGKSGNRNLITKITDYYINTGDNSENEITRVMQSQLSLDLKTISEKQGAIHLHNFYCVEGKCRDCYIGNIVFDEPQVKDCLKIILY